jgi:hypothetical protein
MPIKYGYIYLFIKFNCNEIIISADRITYVSRFLFNSQNYNERLSFHKHKQAHTDCNMIFSAKYSIKEYNRPARVQVVFVQNFFE